MIQTLYKELGSPFCPVRKETRRYTAVCTEVLSISVRQQLINKHPDRETPVPSTRQVVPQGLGSYHGP